jgi:hypothetical protein
MTYKEKMLALKPVPDCLKPDDKAAYDEGFNVALYSAAVVASDADFEIKLLNSKIQELQHDLEYERQADWEHQESTHEMAHGRER